MQARPIGQGAGRRDVRRGPGVQVRRRKSGHPCRSRAKMAADVPRDREGRPAENGREALEIRLRDQGRRSQGRGRRRDVCFVNTI